MSLYSNESRPNPSKIGLWCLKYWSILYQLVLHCLTGIYKNLYYIYENFLSFKEIFKKILQL
jgi:hypothetical protein